VTAPQDSVKERIIDASIKLFLTKGFTGATTKELTVAAGVAKGTLYWHFPSKDRILDEILDRFSHDFYDAAFDAVTQCGGDFLKRFKTFYRFITEFARDKKELLQVSSTILGEIAGSGTPAEEKMRAIQMKAHAFIKNLVEQGQRERTVDAALDASLQAHIILANFLGMHLQWCLQGDSFDAVSYARAYRSTILKGLGCSDRERHSRSAILHDLIHKE
jgi:AcrR family transcriptional regulator